MKILIHSHGKDQGGVFAVMEKWYQGFTRDNHQVVFLTDGDGHYTKYLQESQREVYSLNRNSTRIKRICICGYEVVNVLGWCRNFYESPEQKNKIHNVFQQVQPDCVLGNGILSAVRLGKICKKTNIPLINCFHNVPLANDFLNLRRIGIARQLNKYSSCVVGVSRLSIERMQPHLKVPCKVIYNTCNPIEISLVRRDEFRKKHDIPADALVYGVASRIAPERNIHVFVSAAEKLISKYPEFPFKFLIAGVPPHGAGEEYQKEIQAKLTKQSLEEKIQFVGFQDMQDFLSGIDVFCQTLAASRQEALGLSIVEALSAGLPSVICNQGGFLEFLPDDVAVRYSPDSADELCAAMEKMIDPDFRKTQSQRSGAFYENDYIKFEQWTGEYLAVIQSLAMSDAK